MRQHKKVTSSEKLIDLFGQMQVSTPCFERDAQEKESLPHEKDMTP